ncbi:hypothetical protein [Ferrimonas marina]|uniref:Uncharacterized protein n=1 Tax=Ferrimonas marina TaxID=299255 RepID=A0A1M5U1D1_9GAMM|nr:hypothetical protein [Ferrimonas marina]SHH56832.1 hypothetical protein SAMN02745129_2367 [Ferrimonas marina]
MLRGTNASPTIYTRPSLEHVGTGTGIAKQGEIAALYLAPDGCEALSGHYLEEYDGYHPALNVIYKGRQLPKGSPGHELVALHVRFGEGEAFGSALANADEAIQTLYEKQGAALLAGAEIHYGARHHLELPGVELADLQEWEAVAGVEVVERAITELVEYLATEEKVSRLRVCEEEFWEMAGVLSELAAESHDQEFVEGWLEDYREQFEAVTPALDWLDVDRILRHDSGEPIELLTLAETVVEECELDWECMFSFALANASHYELPEMDNRSDEFHSLCRLAEGLGSLQAAKASLPVRLVFEPDYTRGNVHDAVVHALSQTDEPNPARAASNFMARKMGVVGYYASASQPAYAEAPVQEELKGRELLIIDDRLLGQSRVAKLTGLDGREIHVSEPSAELTR